MRNISKGHYNVPAWFYHGVVVFSALFFAISSLLAKLAVRSGVSAYTITFSRFAMGLILVLIFIFITRQKIQPRNTINMILRGVFNMAAILLFYSAVKYTTITNANLLNMTYPVFVALLSPILLTEHLKVKDWILLGLAGVGIYLVVNPSFQQVNPGNILGLGCGFAASLAVIMLRRARRDNQTATVLLFMLATGTLLTWPAVLTENFTAYTRQTWMILLACGATGIMGQFAITMAFKHITAVAGSVTGTSRVVIAALLGFMFLAEVPSWNIVVGGVILFTAIGIMASSKRENTPLQSR